MSILVISLLASIGVMGGVSFYKRWLTQRWLNEQKKGPLPNYDKAPQKTNTWFTQSLILQGVTIVLIFFVIRNIQNEVPWGDWTWAFYLPPVVVALGYLFYRFFSVDIPLIEGAPPTPPQALIFRKAATTITGILLVAILIIRGITTSLESWPILQKHADNTGLSHFIAVFIAPWWVSVVAVILLTIGVLGSKRINTIRLPGIVDVHGESLVPRPPDIKPTPVTVPTAAAPTATPRRSFVLPWSQVMKWGFILGIIYLLLWWVFGFKVDRDYWKLLPESNQQQIPGKRTGTPFFPMLKEAEEIPRNNVRTLNANAVNNDRYIQYVGAKPLPMAKVIPAGQWTTVKWPAETKSSSYRYISFDRPHLLDIRPCDDAKMIWHVQNNGEYTNIMPDEYKKIDVASCDFAVYVKAAEGTSAYVFLYHKP